MLRTTLAWTFSSLLATTAVFAQEPATARPRVVVVADPNTAREQSRITGDLEARGYEVISVQPPRDDNRAETAASTQRLDAVATLRVRDGGLIEIWIAGPSHGPSTMRDLVAPFSATDDARSDAVVQALELLRAHLIQVRTPNKKAAEATSPITLGATAPKKQHAAPAVPRRFAAAAGVGVLHATGGVSSALGVTVQLRMAASAVWGVSVDGFVPVRGGSLDRPEASATVTPWLAGAGIWIAPWTGRLRPHGEAGLSLAVLSMSADANPGYLGRSERLLAGSAHLGVGVTVSLSPDVGIRVNGRAGRNFPHDTLRFVDKDAAEWGPYLFSASAALEWRF